MTPDWETTFVRWSKPPSQSEEARCSNAIRLIKEALNNHPDLKNKKTEIILQGSHKNNTNIRLDSDIDICIRLMDVFFDQYPNGYRREDYGNTGASYTYSQFKDTVGEALRNKFGYDQVLRGNKAFTINSNSYRVKADVVATFEHRRYTNPPQISADNYLSGVELITDKGQRIINWPIQHHENGVKKNTNTKRRYKRCVRIFKNLRNEMADDSISIAVNFPSFLIECLCWNVPNPLYNHSTYVETMKGIMVYLHENTAQENRCKEWVEVSKLKYLFHESQPWTYEDANQFIEKAWTSLGF